jgi:hypothetical protein
LIATPRKFVEYHHSREPLETILHLVPCFHSVFRSIAAAKRKEILENLQEILKKALPETPFILPSTLQATPCRSVSYSHDGRNVWFTLERRLSKEATGVFVLILEVHATGRLAGIGSVGDGAVLPVRVVHELALEAEGVVDVGEAELDIVALSYISVIICLR